VDGAATAGALVEVITREVGAWVSTAPGFLLSSTHVGFDGSTVVHHTRWSDDAGYRGSFLDAPDAGVLRGLGRRPGVLASSTFTGATAGGIDGPEAGRPPGVVAVATRHLTGPGPARAVVDLLHRTGEWKRDFPGFVSAAAYLSLDSRTFVNYPMWVDRSAYDAWMADPRIAEGQAEIARLEAAPPEYLVGTVAAHCAAPHVPEVSRWTS
jgi:quinol monooxygenase YgiN